MVPAGGPRLVQTEVIIQGTGFPARGVQSLSAHGGIRQDDGYTASLDGVALLSVQRISETQLRAIVPAGLDAGSHALTVVGPYGLAATLPDAWLASDLSASHMSASMSAPQQVSTGQVFSAALTVQNDGGATAKAVLPVVAAGPFDVRSGPAAQDIPGGESRTFQWSLSASQPGTISIEAVANGTDSVSRLAVTTAPSAAQTLVQLHSALRAEAEGPAQVQVSVGQTVHVTLAATNMGEAAALAVSVPPPLGASPALQLVSQPAAQDVAGALGTATFDWTYLAAQPGDALLSASGAGVDQNDGQPVSVGTVSWPLVTVQSPAALALTPSPPPAQVSVGQSFAVAITVQNQGQATAAAVQPALTATGSGTVNVVSAPSMADIAGNGSAVFTWVLSAAGPGSIAFSASASGADVNSGVVSSAGGSAGSTLVQTPPSLSATLSASPSSVSTGQPFQLKLDVTNAGQATAASVLPDVPTADPAAHVLQAPAAQDVPGGATRSFVWTYSIDAAGTFDFSASAAGFDQNSGVRVATAPAVSNGVTVALAAFLEATVALDRSQADVGQNVTATVTVSNVGQVDALGVTTTPSVTGSASLVSSPSAQDIPAQTSRTFIWTWQATASGPLSFSFDASGTDANSAATVSASATAGPVVVQTPAALSATARLTPAQASTGQTLQLDLDVTNSGQATAVAVAPSVTSAGTLASVLSSPAAQDVPGGMTRTFTWTYRADAPGTLSLTASGAGSDVNTGVAVSASAAPVSSLIQSAAALSASARLSQGTASTGQTIQLFLDVTNSGQATASQFTPSTPSPDAPGTAIAASPVAADVPGGSTVTFTWTISAQSSATVHFSLGGSATDGNSGVTVSASAQSPALTVQTAAQLTATPHAPSTVDVGQSFQVSVDVTNAGQAGATVVPGAPAVGGTGAATLASGPSTTTVAGSSTQTLTWTYSATQKGTLSFTFGPTATDVNSGATVSPASVNASTLIQTPTALSAVVSVSPSTIDDNGQITTVTMTVNNTGESTAISVAPTLNVTGSGAVLVSGPTPAKTQIPGGSSRTFTWSYKASATGTLTFSGSAAGSDDNTGQAVSATATGTNLTVLAPAALSVAWTTPTAVSVGQSYQITLTVTNAGDSAAIGVVPSAPTLGGTGIVTGGSVTPTSGDIAGHANRAFTFNYTGSAAGTVTFNAGASGTDATDGSTVTAPAVTSSSVLVQTPAQLSSTAHVPATVDVGQSFQVSVDVTNSGQAGATVTPGTPGLSGAGAATLSSGPATTTVPGGSTRTLTWTYSATQKGALSFTFGPTATDVNSGATVSPASVSGSTLIQTPAALTAAIALNPSTINDNGQTTTVTMTVNDTGEATAQSVAPTLNVTGTGATRVSGPTPASAAITGGGSQTFSWSYKATTPGTLTFSGSAAGTDANTAQSVSATAAGTNLTVLAPAALTVAWTTPAVVNVGQAFQATLTASNSGDSAANAVAPSTVTISGTGSVTGGSFSPASATIAGHGSSPFVYNYTGATTGTVAFRAGAAGTDATDGNAVSAAAVTSSNVTVQTPSSLSASMSIGSMLQLGSTFTATLTVTNSGDASVSSLAPSTPTVSGAGAASLASGPSPSTPVTLAGHASQVFTWTFSANSEGAIQISATASGTDATDGGARSASATSASGTIGEAFLIASDPFGDGTTFTYITSFLGQVWLGPDKNGTGAVRMNPDGTSPQPVPWQLEHNTAAKNTAWAGTPANTIGFKGCTANTTACGPDDESGRGLFFNGTLSGTEWLGLAGAHVNTGTDYARYLYMTKGSFPLVSGGATDFAYMDLAGNVSTSATALTSAAFFEGNLYLGIQGSGAPLLEQVGTMPSVPGTAPSVNDMGAANMTGISTANGAMIDTLAVFGTSPNDAIYLANKGGFTRSTSTSPTQCALLTLFPPTLLCPDWTNATPSDSNWGNKTSTSTTKTSDLEPADRAIPAMASFGGRFYAARNTTTGPQLWVCVPTNSGQCGTGDWSLLAANTTGDNKLSQFNDSNNAAVTLLAATPEHLYVGFNNATRGVVIYRTSNTSASALTDFTGRLGCAATGSTCAGYGRDGLGAGLTRIADGKAFSYSGADYLYVAAGTGTGPISVYRVTQ